MSTGDTWLILVIDDSNSEDVREIIEEKPDFLGPNIHVETDTIKDFEEGKQRIQSSRYDLVVLDLRKDSHISMDSEDDLVGLEVFNKIKESRFVPIVFYTALPRHVEEHAGAFVKVVERGEETQLLKAIKEVFETGLMQLNRDLEEEQRKYMWETVLSHCPELYSPETDSGSNGEDTTGMDQHRRVDIAYLLTRRLASFLMRESPRHHLHRQANTELLPDGVGKMHPMELYIYPPMDGQHIRAGDVFKVKDDQGNDQYWVVLTPSCDITQKKADRILFGTCLPLADHEVVQACKPLPNGGGEPSQGDQNRLRQLLRNSKDRYYFLPRTFFLPDLLVDLQDLRHVKFHEDEKRIEWNTDSKHITTLDTPFAEALVNRFGRYYGRIGTPDLDVDLAKRRLLTPNA